MYPMKFLPILLLNIFFGTVHFLNAQPAGGRSDLIIEGIEQTQSCGPLFISFVVDAKGVDGTVEFAGDYNIVESNATFSFTAEESGFFYAFLISDNDTLLSDTVFLTIDNLLAPVAVADTLTLCPEEQALLFSFADPAGIVTWEPMEGIVDPDQVLPKASPQSSTLYTYRATSDLGICNFEGQIFVEVKNVNINFAQGDSLFLCKGQGPINILLDTLGKIDHVFWRGPGIDTSGASVLSISVNPDISGRYSIQGRGEGCVFNRSLWLQVDSLPLLPIDIAPVKDPYCPGDTVVLFSPTPSIELYGPMKYLWNPDDNRLLTPSTVLNASVVLFDTITYTRRVINGACSRIDSILIEVPVPKIDLLWLDTIICSGETVSNLILNADELEDISWNPEEGLSCTNCTNPSTSTAGVYTVSATKDGCPTEASMRINFFAEFINIALVSDTTVIALGDTIDIIAVTSPEFPEGWTYLWTINGNPIPQTEDSLRFYVLMKNNTILLEVISPNGCPLSTQINFEAVEPEIVMPNAFTPNNDGLNDFFNIVYKKGGPLPVLEFLIINRWGEVVYNNPGQPQWDGRTNNRDAISETYAYRVSVLWPNGETRTYKGEVTVLR
jgi:gliding motility-associated-like protein